MEGEKNETIEPVKRAKRARPKGRAVRWQEAASAALGALDTIENALSDFEAACSDLDGVRQEFEEWKDNLPENLQGSTLGERLETVSSLEIEDIAATLRSAFDDARSAIEEAEATDLPLGFGRD